MIHGVTSQQHGDKLFTTHNQTTGRNTGHAIKTGCVTHTSLTLDTKSEHVHTNIQKLEHYHIL